MRLLIITQKVDKNDSVLGFFHSWIEEFAHVFEKIVVICLQSGNYNLPENVKVLSLGKEKHPSDFSYWRKIRALILFYRYLWRERKNYDSVFVHMNQEYVLLGGLFWRLTNKKIYFWRNHPSGNFFTKLAVFFSDKVFCTSKYAFVAKYKKTNLMPAGIDTEKFRIQEEKSKIKNSILYLGRISPIKNVNVLIEAVQQLDKEGVDFVLNIVGGIGERDRIYFEKIKNSAKEMEQNGRIKFLGEVPNYKTPEIYQQNEILVNLTKTGSFDKVILEAMACGVLPIISNKSFENILGRDFIFKEGDSKDLAEKIKKVLNIPQEERWHWAQKFSRYVIENHSLGKLISQMMMVL